MSSENQPVLTNTILTPIIQSEIKSLLYWIERCPLPCFPEDISNLYWFISMDQVWSDSDKLCIINAIEKSSLSCINVSFLNCKIKPNQSVYYRENPSFDTSHLEYGLKSGPNIQFFNSINQIIEQQKLLPIKAVTLLEVDAFPLKQYWVNLINKSISKEGCFYICGSTHQGLTKIGAPIKYHINGNAIYNLSHPNFISFLYQWKNILKKSLTINFSLAYDCCLEYSLNVSSCWQLLSKDEQSFLLNHYLPRRVTLNKTIINLSESSVENLLKLSHLFSQAVILHDKNYPLLNKTAE